MPDRQTNSDKITFAIKKKTLLICGAVALCLCAGLCGAVIAMHFTPEPALTPDTLPAAEARAVTSVEGPSELNDTGGSVRLSFSNRVYISLADREASLNFSTPEESDQSMVLELYIRDRLILQSGALTPGSTLKNLLLLDGVRLQPGGYDGEFRVSFYDPHTGAMARVDAQIPVKVTVTEQ